MIQNPEALFEIFYKDITSDMNPPGFPKYHCSWVRSWWLERFMNAYHGIKEPNGLRSWAEAPQMWLAGYRRAQQQEEAI